MKNAVAVCLSLMLLPFAGRADQSNVVQLPPPDAPLEYAFAVEPGDVMEVCGTIADSGATNVNSGSAILLVNFTDGAGGQITAKSLPYSTWLKGNFSYLAGASQAVPFSLAIPVPENARKANVRLAKLERNADVRLDGFSCSIAVQENPFRAMFLLVGVFFSAVALQWWKIGLRRTMYDADTRHGAGGAFARAWGAFAAAMAAVVAIVFLHECRVAIRSYAEFFPSFTLLSQFSFLVLFSVVVYAFARNRPRRALVVVMLSCLALHVAAIRLTHSLYSQAMISDFAAPESCIKSPWLVIGHPAEFPYWCNYELLCSFLGKVFVRDVQVAQFLNALCCTAAIYPVFRISERIGGLAAAIFTSALMGLSPLTAVYGTILTSEFIAAAAYAYATYFLLQTLCAQTLCGKCRTALMAAVFLGTGQLLRPIAEIFLATAAVLAAFDMVHVGRRAVFRWVAVLSLLLGAHLLVSRVGQRVIADIAKPQRIQIGGSHIMDSLLTGLNPDIHGICDVEWTRKCSALGVDARRALLREMIAAEYRRFPALFFEKLDRAYSDSAFGWWWYEQTIAPSQVSAWLKVAMADWNVIVLGLLGLGALGLGVSIFGKGERCLAGVVAATVLCGFTSAMLLVECQSRYKMAIYPTFFLVIPYAIWILGAGCRRISESHALPSAILGGIRGLCLSGVGRKGKCRNKE